MYPKLGPGQLWEHVAELVTEKGGEIHMDCKVKTIHVEGRRMTSVTAVDADGHHSVFEGELLLLNNADARAGAGA